MSGTQPTPTVVLTSASIITRDPTNTMATSLAIRGDRIVAVGDHAAGVGPRAVTIDLDGATVPNMYDLERQEVQGCGRCPR